jgi:hypothetical protein
VWRKARERRQRKSIREKDTAGTIDHGIDNLKLEMKEANAKKRLNTEYWRNWQAEQASDAKLHDLNVPSAQVPHWMP